MSQLRRRAVVMVMSALALAACDTTQPDRLTTRSASVSFRAAGNLSILSCYEIWRDTSNPLDGTPDIDLGFTQCYEQGGGTFARPIPWHYSYIISIIRAGTTSEELLFSNEGVPGTTSVPDFDLDPFISMTDYDPSATPAPFRFPEGNTVFVNGRDVSWGSRIYLGGSSASCGICPTDLGVANIGLGSPSFDFELDPGDTVLVRARKQLFSQSPGFLPKGATPALVQISLVATLTIGGVDVAPNGTSATSGDDGSDLSFSYTVH